VIIWPSSGMPISILPRSISGGLSISSKGQQRWLDRDQRQSHITTIGDRWPDTLATHSAA
jgi:hypothetical protein